MAYASQHAFDPALHTHTMGIRTSARCDFDHSIGAFSFVTKLRYADKRIGIIMEVQPAYHGACFAALIKEHANI